MRAACRGPSFARSVVDAGAVCHTCGNDLDCPYNLLKSQWEILCVTDALKWLCRIKSAMKIAADSLRNSISLHQDICPWPTLKTRLPVSRRLTFAPSPSLTR